MNTTQATSPVRQAAVNGLAVVGFVALITAGLWLAIYSTRFVPAVVNRIGSAAVYLGSVFTPAPRPSSLSVVPTPVATTTIGFGDGAATSTTTTPAKTPTTKPVTGTKTGTKTGTTYSTGGTPVAPHGLADLAVSVTTTGYLTTASTDSFVASTTVPHGDRPAVRFTIKNVGTNYSGTWTFSASIPTRPAFTFKSPAQQSLAPGDSIDYTLGFDQAITGDAQVITLSVDSTVSDSNKNNNTATAGMTVK